MRMYCPNCGHKVAGYAEGQVFRKTCPKCRAAIFSMTGGGKKREVKIRVTATGESTTKYVSEPHAGSAESGEG